MKSIQAFCLPLLLIGCATVDKAQAIDIQAVSFKSTTGTVAPQYWRGETLTIRSSLQTQLVVTGEYGNKVIETHDGKISQAQFNTLVNALRAADFTQTKSTPLNPPPIGGGSTSLTIQTDQGNYEFQGPSTSVFPPAIGKIFQSRGLYTH
jgi:hypothetical protein